MLRIGCHLSSARGYLAMGKEAVEIGANTFQFFTRNPRGGRVKPLDTEDIRSYVSFAAEHDLTDILAHAPYTVNPSSAKEDVREFAVGVLREDIERLELIPGSMLNFHPGSHVKQGVERGIDFIVQALDLVLTPGQKTLVLLETMSGKGTEVGASFEELETILERVHHDELLGVCLDTCHVHDAGFDIVCDLDGVLEEFDRIIGLSRLRAIHLNDSKNPRGSHKDRHEKIGEGEIGLEALARVINHPLLRELPFYLETPNELSGYAHEIQLLRSLYKS